MPEPDHKRMSVLSAAKSQRRSRSLWTNVSFMLMWSSVFASGFGDRMIQLAAWPLLGMNREESQAASIQAAVAFFFFLPYPLFGPIGGWLADTFPRKWIMLICDEARALVLLGGVILLWVYAPGYAGEPIDPDAPLAWLATWGTYGIIALTGVFAAIFAPTRDATVPQIVPFHQLQPANAIVLAIATIASLIGLGIGGWIIDAYSVGTAVIIGFLCFLISGWFFAFMRVRPHVAAFTRTKHESEWRRLTQAASFLHGHWRLISLIALGVMFWGLAGVVVAAIAALCKLSYGIATEDLTSSIAIMQATLGAGMLISSLVLAFFIRLRETGWLIMLGLILSGLSLVGMWAVRDYNVGLVLAFVLGFASNIARVCTDTLTQALSANYIRGRIFGLREIVATGSLIVVNFIIWRLPDADHIMIAAVLPLAGILLIVGLINFFRIIPTGPLPSRATNIYRRLLRLYLIGWHRVQWIDKHHVPGDGPVILAPNHTAAIDPFLIQTGMRRLVRWVMTRNRRYPALEFFWKTIDPITLERDDSDFARIRQLVRSLHEGQVVGLFPEGGLQRDHRELQPFQPGAAVVARRTDAWIVPVWISGTPRARSMFWHFCWPSQSMVLFGKAYKPDPKMDNDAVMADLRRRMLDLKDRSQRLRDHPEEEGALAGA